MGKKARGWMHLSRGDQLVLLGVVIVVSIAWLADAVIGVELFKAYFNNSSGFFTPKVYEDWYFRLIFAFIIFMLLIYSINKAKALQLSRRPVRTLQKEDQVTPKKALIFMLSPYKSQYKLEDHDTGWRVSSLINQVCAELSGDVTQLDQDIAAFDVLGRCNLQQVLRLLKPHKTSLEYIHILGTQDESEQCKGSHRESSEVINWLRSYFPNASIVTAGRPINANSIDEAYDEYGFVIDTWLDNTGLNESDIVIDMTGGKSCVSVAAALATLHNDVSVQYVDTNDGNKVLNYTMRYEHKDELQGV